MERGRNRSLPKVLSIKICLSLSLSSQFTISRLPNTNSENTYYVSHRLFPSCTYIYTYISSTIFRAWLIAKYQGRVIDAVAVARLESHFQRVQLSLSLSLGALYQIKIWCKLHVITLPRVHYTAQAFHGTPPSLEEWRTPAPFSYPCGHVSRLMER